VILIEEWSARPSLHAIMNTQSPVGIVALLVILAGIFISTFFHELGHYIVYSKFGGKTSSMGIAFMIGFLPVLYVSTNSLYLWSNKVHRILVAAAGILVDVLLLIMTVDVLFMSFPSFLSFYLIFFLALFVVRILANLNPFIPGTDGYFMLTDIISVPSLYQTAAFNTHKFARNVIAFQFQLIDKFQLLSMLYLSFSVFFITSYYLLIGAFILFPFIFRFFL
jgi:Zn-dependent protease